MRIRPLAFLLAVLALASAASSQRVAGGPDAERKGSTVIVYSDSFQTLAAVSISYSQPTWQDGYANQLESLKGTNYTRLGKGWWTSLDTVGLIEIGGTKLEAGSYYLGLRVDNDDKWSLLVFDSRQAMKDALQPGTTALYTGEKKPIVSMPLTFTRDASKDVVAKMEIEITADQKAPSNGRFSIRWGKHELSAKVVFHLAEPKSETAEKK
ncbi:MAG: hypothetical protein ABL997_18320 [Planctomycetota bacterium]